MPTTLQHVVDRITLDYLRRSDLNAETIRAVQAAIRQYERKRWPWNETTTTLTTVAAQSFVTIPTDFFVLDLLEVQFQSATYELKPLDFSTIRRMNTAPGSSDLPTNFALRAGAFELTPIPDSAYLLNCHHLKQLTPLTATDMTGTNDWLSAAEDLIVYHATKLLWANVLRNNEEATKYAQLERGALIELNSYNSQRVLRAIRATQF